MGLSTWLKQNRLKRTESKLRQLRGMQRRYRELEADALNMKKAGSISAEEYQQRLDKLHEDRERTTHQINELLGEEERLRQELRAEGAAA